MLLASPYVVRPYRGRADHPAMTEVLAEYREQTGDPELPTVEQIDIAYANLHGCDPDTDIAIIEQGDEVVAYARASYEDLESSVRDCVAFAPIRADHLTQPLFAALLAAEEAHTQPWAGAAASARFRTHAAHPGAGKAPVGEAEWLEALGYEAIEWGASLVRPNLDDIPDRSLPQGVELRPVTAEQVRPIVEAHIEAFRGEWDFREPIEADYRHLIEHPYRDETLWKVAWVAEAALGVNTNDPGGAFQVYTGLGFELQTYEAAYTKVIH